MSASPRNAFAVVVITKPTDFQERALGIVAKLQNVLQFMQRRGETTMSYLYEQLSPEKFQQLCQALISREFPNTQCFPAGQPDGGRDAITRSRFMPRGTEFTGFQVKFSRSSDRPTEEFIDHVLELERTKIENLKSRGMSAYFVITNVKGTAHLDAGLIDRAQSSLDTLGIPAFCWWRDDLDRRIDASADIKWSYPEIIRGSDLLQALLSGTLGEDRHRRDNAVKAYIAAQYAEDREVKFKQVDLFNNLLDLFVDTDLAEVGGPDDLRPVHVRSEVYHYSAHFERTRARAASSFLTFDDRSRRIVLEGAPGQGKSTITQYVCQIHRVRLLDRAFELSKVPNDHFSGTVRIPLRVDLRDFASWLTGKNPFSSDLSSVRPPDMPPSLEGFLAFQLFTSSGGHTFNVSDLSSLARTSHLLIVLDGFDEVADIPTREHVVKEISKGANRLEAASRSLLIIVTSRPAAFAKSPGFSHKEWRHFALQSMNLDQINHYADKWMNVRNLPGLEREKFRQVLRQKLDQAHMRDLARNPMQLAILLNLIQTKGLSLPDKRTHLYDSYMDLFFSREAEKSVIVREHRDLLIELHRYLAWVLQTEAEGTKSAGSVTEDRLKHLLRSYLARQGHQTTIVSDLFTGMTERVVALVSRVQGTFEFEVQPLREYFAARHLYETAPYSPPGLEQSGTKPERFDALARNFYWLNVTRFYCGCYSPGELASLADGLIHLSDKEGLKEISYPRVLIAMLLSDWVFTQQPYIVRRLLQHLVSQPAFKILLANANNDRASANIIPPERCGRDDLLAAVSSWFNAGLQRDVCIALASTIRENLPQDDAIDFWRKMQPEPNKVGKWFLFGRLVGAFSAMAFAEVRPLFELYPNSTTSSLLLSERYDILESDPRMFEAAAGTMLDYSASAPHGPFEKKSLILAHLSLAFDNSVYSLIFTRQVAVESGSHRAMLKLFRRHLTILEEEFSPTAPSFASPAWQSCQRFLMRYHEMIDAPCEQWASSLKPWNAIVEAGLSEWGPRPVLLDIALISAKVTSKTERGKFGAGFGDDTVPLCERIRFARFKSGAPNWWLTQLEQADNDLNVAISALLCWATPRTILKVSGTADKLMEQLDAQDWSQVVDRIRTAVEIDGTIELTVDGINAVTSDRLFLALALRLNNGQKDSLLFDRFRTYSGHDREILQSVTDAAIRLAHEDSRKWSAAIAVIRRAYSQEVTSTLLYQHVQPDFNIPENVATTVCQSAEEYPLAIVSSAQNTLQSSMGKKIGKPLGDIAVRDKWFSGSELLM